MDQETQQTTFDMIPGIKSRQVASIGRITYVPGVIVCRQGAGNQV